MKRLVVVVVLSLAAITVIGAVTLASARGEFGPARARQTVPAPIDQVQVLIRESALPQVTVQVRAGLPGGCAQRESHSVVRSGDTFTVRVLNSMPSGDAVCTMIYGTYELSIDLGGPFTSGATYTVHVNDRTTTFKT